LLGLGCVYDEDFPDFFHVLEHYSGVLPLLFDGEAANGLGLHFFVHYLARDQVDRLLDHVDGQLAIGVRDICDGALGEQKLHDQLESVFRRNMQGRIISSLAPFIRVLTLTDQDPHHVEVLLSASAPNLVQRKFDFVILCQVERQFVLRCAHFLEDSVVTLKLDQLIDDFGVAIVHRVVKAGPFAMVCCVQLNILVLKHGLHSFIAALFAGKVQSLALQIVFSRYVGAIIQQKLD